MLESIITGVHPEPRRVMLYGTAGIGKSTFAAQAPKPIFIPTEDGLGSIDCARFPVAESLDQVISALAALYEEKHDFQTVVIDSLDWLEHLIWARVCDNKHVANIEDIDFGKGYSFALTHWRDVLDGLDAIRKTKDMNVVLIAHSRIEKHDNPETDSYDRYSPRLHKYATAMTMEWCDEVLFASYRIHTRTQDGKSSKKRAQGIGDGERVLRTTERPAHIAKNRLGLPDELPLDWMAFAEFLPHTNTNSKTTQPNT